MENENFIGQKYGRITILRNSELRKGRRKLYECVCACGTKFLAERNRIISGHKRSCGCSRKEKQNLPLINYQTNPPENIINKKFSRLLVIEDSGRRDNKGAIKYKCLCDCGTITYPTRGALKHQTKSCGCLQKEVVSKDRSNSVINGITIFEKLSLRGKNRCIMYRAKCPKCNRTDWIVRGSSLISAKIKMCKNCQLLDILKHATSKTGTALLDKLENSLGYTILREYHVKNRFFDGCILDKKILIESNGTYFHSLPGRAANDVYKNQLAKEAGFELISVWNDGLQDHDACLQEILNHPSLR